MSLIDQARSGFEALMNMNISNATYIKNGIEKIELVRISHESGSVPKNVMTTVGLGTNFSMFAEMKHGSELEENDILIINGQGWKLGVIDSILITGQVYGKRSPLTAIKLSSAKSITSFKFGTITGLISGLNIMVTLPLLTDVTNLLPVIVMSQNARIDKTLAQDFTAPVTYKVTAQDLSTQDYLVSVVLV